MSNEPNKKKTSIFFRSLTKDGKGVKKDEVIKFDKYDLKTFFKLFGRRFGEIVKINWLYIMGNFPILFLLLAISGNFSHAALAPQSQFYPIVYGIFTISGESATIAPLMGINGIMGTVTSYSVIDYILIGFSALFLVTFGLVNVSGAYLMRNIVRGEHLFFFDDIRMTIKQNYKQGLIFGVLDLIVLLLCGFSISYYLTNYSQYFVLFFSALAVTCFYLFIRQYVYMMMVTFDLPFGKLLKNSFILATLNLGKGFLALFIVAFIVVMSVALSSIFMPIGIIILMMLLFSTAVYIFTYLTFPKMKSVMIDPYYPNYGKETEEEEYDEDVEESENNNLE